MAANTWIGKEEVETNGSLNWSRLSEQKVRVDKWSLSRIRPPRGAEEDQSWLIRGPVVKARRPCNLRLKTIN